MRKVSPELEKPIRENPRSILIPIRNSLTLMGDDRLFQTTLSSVWFLILLRNSPCVVQLRNLDGGMGIHLDLGVEEVLCMCCCHIIDTGSSRQTLGEHV